MVRTALLVVALASATAACSRASSSASPSSSSSSVSHSEADLKTMTIDDVAARVEAHDGKTFVYDNNSKESWAKAHVPTAKWLDQNAIAATDLPGDKTATLIFYCHNEG